MAVLPHVHHTYAVHVNIPALECIQAAHLQHPTLQRPGELYLNYQPHTDLVQSQHKLKLELPIRERQSIPHRKVYLQKFRRGHVHNRRLQYGL
jgi:hypothetical protein